MILGATKDMSLQGHCKLKIPKGESTEAPLKEGEVRLDLDMSEWDLDAYKQVDGDMPLLTLLTTAIVERRAPTEKELKCFKPTKKGLVDLKKLFTLILDATKDMTLTGRCKLKIPKMEVQDACEDGEVKLNLDMSEWDLDAYERIGGDMDLITLLTTCIVERREPTEKELKCFKPTKKDLIDLKKLFSLILDATKDMSLQGNCKLKNPKMEVTDPCKDISFVASRISENNFFKSIRSFLVGLKHFSSFSVGSLRSTMQVVSSVIKSISPPILS
jgi:hypothetical protein